MRSQSVRHTLATVLDSVQFHCPRLLFLRLPPSIPLLARQWHRAPRPHPNGKSSSSAVPTAAYLLATISSSMLTPISPTTGRTKSSLSTRLRTPCVDPHALAR